MILPGQAVLAAPIAAIVLAGNVLLQSSSMMLLSVSDGIGLPPSVVSSSSPTIFDFGNGSSVRVETPMRITALPYLLTNPQFLGAGGGGAVFSYERQQPQPTTEKTTSTTNRETAAMVDVLPKDKVVVKFSWLQSADSVRNECQILNAMEQQHVSGVERCLAQLEYPDDPRRTILVMEPVIEDGVSSLSELSPKAALTATKTLMTTMAQMLVARVVTADLQPLISKTTGDVILIDMTEAKVLPDGKLSDLDKALVSEFCNEVMSLIPDTLLTTASVEFSKETSRIETESKLRLDNVIRAITESLLSID